MLNCYSQALPFSIMCAREQNVCKAERGIKLNMFPFHSLEKYFGSV